MHPDPVGALPGPHHEGRWSARTRGGRDPSPLLVARLYSEGPVLVPPGAMFPVVAQRDDVWVRAFAVSPFINLSQDRPHPLSWRGHLASITLGHSAGKETLVKTLRAVGGLVWQRMAFGPKVAIVRRKEEGDWILPHAEILPDEDSRTAAYGEVFRLTGCDVRLTSFAGANAYETPEGPRVVLYWNMELIGELGPPDPREVSELLWVTPQDAVRRLARPHDCHLLAHAVGNLPPTREAFHYLRNEGGQVPRADLGASHRFLGISP